MFLIIIGIIVIILLYICHYYYTCRLSNFPPGPWGLPFVGFIVRKNDCEHLTELSEQYGPILGYFSGKQPMVVLNSIGVIREALVTKGDCFIDRVTVKKLLVAVNEFGLIRENGKIFREQRRFALQTLRDLGFGKSMLEGSIIEEIHALCTVFDGHKGRPFDPKFDLSCAFANVISQVAFGKRFQYSDRKLFDLIEILYKLLDGHRVAHSSGDQMWSFVLKPLRMLKELRMIAAFLDRSKKFFAQVVKEHRMNVDSHEADDFVFAFLKAQKQNNGNYFHDAQMFAALRDLFIAGAETTSTTVRWAILLLAGHKNVQKKCFQEIIAKIGPDRLPQLSDRQNLPYLEATILETQRFGSAVSLVTRRCTETCQVAGFTIPKGAAILLNIYAAHMDAKTFPNPTMFDPGRFLNETEDKVCNTDLLVPFGAGKRMCLGESLARMELFLYITALIQRYEFSLPDGAKLDLEHRIGLTAQPPPYDIIAKLRF